LTARTPHRTRDREPDFFRQRQRKRRCRDATLCHASDGFFSPPMLPLLLLALPPFRFHITIFIAIDSTDSHATFSFSILSFQLSPATLMIQPLFAISAPRFSSLISH
jgi:hypothetical protein